MRVIFDVGIPSPLAYQDVYEAGDEWVKIKGCESCRIESRRQCCGNCHRLTEDGRCDYQIKPVGSEETRSSNKPWNCAAKPYPSSAMSFCVLEFRCVKGSKAGKLRRVCDPGGVFVEG